MSRIGHSSPRPALMYQHATEERDRTIAAFLEAEMAAVDSSGQGCVYAAVLEALIAQALRHADVRDPDLGDQHLTAPRALRQPRRLRAVTLTAGGHTIDVVTRPEPLRRQVLTALDVDTTAGTAPCSAEPASQNPSPAAM